MLFISEVPYSGNDLEKDIVTIHNYDFDGYLQKDTLIALINSIGKSTKTLGGIETKYESK